MKKTPFNINWSHSALNAYTTCPQKYYREKVTKEVPFIENEALIEGRKMHDALEMYIRGNPGPIAKYPQLRPLALAAQQLPNVAPEVEITLKADLSPTHWKDWGGAWMRCKIDVLSIQGADAQIWDWKTGKYWGPDLQPERNALAMFWAYPEIETVTTKWIYMKPNIKVVEDKFTRDQLPWLMAEPLKVLQNIAASYNDDNWPKTPGRGCRFCGVMTCEFRGKNV